jgi:hypothetical protein
MNNKQWLKQAREEMIKWVPTYRLDYSIVLHPPMTMGPATLRRLVKKFIIRVNKANFGKSSRKQLNMFPVLERDKDGWLHVHLLWGGPLKHLNKEKLEYDLSDIWVSVGGRRPHDGRVCQTWYERQLLPRSEELGINPKVGGRNQRRWFEPVYHGEGILEYVTKTYEYDDLTVEWELVNLRHLPADENA